MKTLYRCLIIVLIFFQIVWFCIPWVISYDAHSINLLSSAGYGSLVGYKIIEVFSYLFTFLYLCCCIGLFFFFKLARTAYFILLLFGGLAIFFYGTSVQVNFEASLGYFMTLADGVILSMSYLSTISKEFDKARDLK